MIGLLQPAEPPALVADRQTLELVPSAFEVQACANQQSGRDGLAPSRHAHGTGLAGVFKTFCAVAKPQNLSGSAFWSTRCAGLCEGVVRVGGWGGFERGTCTPSALTESNGRVGRGMGVLGKTEENLGQFAQGRLLQEERLPGGDRLATCSLQVFHTDELWGGP